MRKVVYISGTRADYGLMASSLKLWDASDVLDVSVCVTGMHLLPEYGHTVDEIARDQLRICAEIPVALSETTGSAMAKAIGSELMGMVDVLASEQPDLVVLMGDRGEMIAGALAALHLNIPIVHIHGGELSGTVDELVRHAISKLSHYHFTATDGAKQRLIRMGELPEHVFTVGAPGLDGLQEGASYSREELCAQVGFSREEKIALLVFHPVVQEVNEVAGQIRTILNVLDKEGLQVVCLLPNADAGGTVIRQEIENFEKSGRQSRFFVISHLPRKTFVSWMKHADVMVGNSSSGIIEAATFSTPVVNVGGRQQGRERSANVTDVDFDEKIIEQAIRDSIQLSGTDTVNIYGDGCSGQKMLQLLCTLPLDQGVLLKLNAY